MLKKLNQLLLWSKHFDEAIRLNTWRPVHSPHLIPNFSAPDRSAWNKRHDEKVAYWRVEGKSRRYSPKFAAFTALSETADELFDAYANEKGTSADFDRMAEALASMARSATYLDEEFAERYFLRAMWRERAAATAKRRS